MSKKKQAPAPREFGSEYPEGYFTELIRRYNWPPQWQSRMGRLETSSQVLGQVAARMERWRAASEGRGWAQGTVVLPNTPVTPLPAWQVRSAG